MPARSAAWASSATLARLSVQTEMSASRASSASRSTLRRPATSLETRTFCTPPRTIASASETFWQQTPTAPRAICILAISGDLWVLACGRSFALVFATVSAMRARLRSSASRSTSSAGVSISSKGMPASAGGAIVMMGSGISGADDPDRGWQRDLAVLLVLRQRFADRLGGSGAHIVRLPVQCAVGGAERNRGVGSAVEAAAERDVEREILLLQLNVREARAGKYAAHPFVAAERERPGIFRSELRHFRHMLIDRLQRGHHPAIGARLAPAGEHYAAARLDRLAHVAERGGRVGEEHHAEAREQQISRGRLERIDRGIGLHELDFEITRRVLARIIKHRRGNIEAEHAPLSADAAREFEGGAAATAADVDDALALCRGGSTVQDLRDRPQQDVLRGLARNPVLSARAV